MVWIEILNARKRRRVWLEADRLRILGKVFSGMTSVSAVARRYDILPQQNYRWRHDYGFDSDLLCQKEA